VTARAIVAGRGDASVTSALRQSHRIFACPTRPRDRRCLA